MSGALRREISLENQLHVVLSTWLKASVLFRGCVKVTVGLPVLGAVCSGCGALAVHL